MPETIHINNRQIIQQDTARTAFMTAAKVFRCDLEVQGSNIEISNGGVHWVTITQPHQIVASQDMAPDTVYIYNLGGPELQGGSNVQALKEHISSESTNPNSFQIFVFPGVNSANYTLTQFRNDAFMPQPNTFIILESQVSERLTKCIQAIIQPKLTEN